MGNSCTQWCLTCGASLVPENMIIHAEWHGKVISQLRSLEERVRDLDARLAEAQEAVTVVERMVVSEVERRLLVREGWTEGRGSAVEG